MSKSKTELEPCLGNYNEADPKCIKCNDKDKCEEIRQVVRTFLIQKLDSGVRQYLVGHLWSIGDALASSPISDELRIIMLCEAFMNTFGTTDLGQTGLVDSDLYDKVKELHSDLTDYLKVMNEIVPKCHNAEEFEVYAEPTLTALEDKWSKKTGQKIFGEPTKILRAIKDEFYDKNVYPKVIAQITTVTSLATQGYGLPFNPSSVPRFRRPDVDGRKGE